MDQRIPQQSFQRQCACLVFAHCPSPSLLSTKTSVGAFTEQNGNELCL
jgi:hypothetical protein